MGYCTTFSELDIKFLDKKKKLCEHEFSSNFCPECGQPKTDNIFQVENLVYSFIENHEGSFCYFLGANCKGYTWQKEMKELSQAFPYLLFTLEGKGDDDNDIWRAYFVDGKMQYTEAKLIYDDFDPTKLSKD